MRGFFIKNHHFKLAPKVATVIAQIACHDNELPQGSPCSPIISNLIGHLLDIRIVNLAKKTKCTYSRYADDLTFSTNKKDFPEKIAFKKNGNDWFAGKSLIKEIEKVGFSINSKKTSMQYRSARQMTTGLIVNEKINIRKEYYKKARSMCHELFQYDEFYIDRKQTSSEISRNESESNNEIKGTLNQLEGILSFIYQVKFPHYTYTNRDKRSQPSAITALYRKFLFYKHFFLIEMPLIISEGKTDIIYLKCALKQLENEYGELVQKKDDGIVFKIGFLNMSKNIKEVFDISEGTSGLLYLMNMYEKKMKTFKGQGRKYPVIMLVDNDDGSVRIKNRIKQQLADIDKIRPNLFYNFVDNLYIMFAPEIEDKAIEYLFDEETLNTTLNGKVFSRSNKTDNKNEYGKYIFAEKVIKAKQKEINFNGFKPVFDKVKLIINEYGKKNA